MEPKITILNHNFMFGQQQKPRKIYTYSEMLNNGQ